MSMPTSSQEAIFQGGFAEVIYNIAEQLWDDGRAVVALACTCRTLQQLLLHDAAASQLWRLVTLRRFGEECLPPRPITGARARSPR